jgi:hypothetical protein
LVASAIAMVTEVAEGAMTETAMSVYGAGIGVGVAENDKVSISIIKAINMPARFIWALHGFDETSVYV